MTFDTSKFARDLRDKAKLTTEQAEGFANAISGVFHDEVATKTETLDLRSAVREDVQNVRASLRETELRLEAKIEAVKSDLVRWVFGAIGFQTLIIIGAIIALVRIVRP